jgi:hypothetical protein
MTSLSKHPKWRSLSSKDKDELKKFKALLALIKKKYAEKEAEHAIKGMIIPIEKPDFIIIAEAYEEIYG